MVHQSILFNHNWNKFQDGNSPMKYHFNSPGGKSNRITLRKSSQFHCLTYSSQNLVYLKQSHGLKIIIIIITIIVDTSILICKWPNNKLGKMRLYGMVETVLKYVYLDVIIHHVLSECPSLSQLGYLSLCFFLSSNFSPFFASVFTFQELALCQGPDFTRNTVLRLT